MCEVIGLNSKTKDVDNGTHNFPMELTVARRGDWFAGVGPGQLTPTADKRRLQFVSALKGQNTRIAIRVPATSGSYKYPISGLARHVLYALIALYALNGPQTDDRVPFTTYQLARILGRSDGGRTYQQLCDAMDELAMVLIKDVRVFHRVAKGKLAQHEVTTVAHLLDAYKMSSKKDGNGWFRLGKEFLAQNLQNDVTIEIPMAYLSKIEADDHTAFTIATYYASLRPGCKKEANEKTLRDLLRPTGQAAETGRFRRRIEAACRRLEAVDPGWKGAWRIVWSATDRWKLVLTPQALEAQDRTDG